MQLTLLTSFFWVVCAIGGLGLAVGDSQDVKLRNVVRGHRPRFANDSSSIQIQSTKPRRSNATISQTTDFTTSTSHRESPDRHSITESIGVSVGLSTSSGVTVFIAFTFNRESTGPASILDPSAISSTDGPTTTTFISALTTSSVNPEGPQSTSSDSTSTTGEGPETISSTTSTEVSTSQQSFSSGEIPVQTTSSASSTPSFVTVTTPFGPFLTMSTSTTISIQVSSTVITSKSLTTETASDKRNSASSETASQTTSPPSSTSGSESTTFAESVPQQITTITSNAFSTVSVFSTLVETATSTGDVVVIFSSPSQESITSAEASDNLYTTTIADATATISIPGAGEGPAFTNSVTITETTSLSFSVTETKLGHVATLSAPESGTTVASKASTPIPTIVQTNGFYTYVGCFTEGKDQRALQCSLFSGDSNTVALCLAESYPYKFAGVEYGRECWCGDSFKGGSTQSGDEECGTACAANPTEICGGNNRLSVYAFNGSTTGERPLRHRAHQKRQSKHLPHWFRPPMHHPQSLSH